MLKLFYLLLLSSVLFSSDNSELDKNSLIIYNNLALFHEQTSINIKKIDKKIIYSDVASSIIIDSVNIKLPNSINLYSQQYKFDKLNKKKLLKNSINKEVLLNNKKATLLSYENNICLVQTKDKKIILAKINEIVFENILDNLITKPSLIFNIDTNKDLNTTMDIQYLIKNIGFNSSYILNIKDNKADISGWINITNNSGKEFKNTKLFILAGDIKEENNIVSTLYRANSSLKMTTEASNIEQKDYEGYHFYKIPFNVNLSNHEKTNIKFFTQNNIDIKRKYKVIMSNPLYFYGEKNHKTKQYIHISNINTPLPKGIIRTYSKLNNHTVFLGENRISNKAKNTPLNIEIGNNFDINIKEKIEQRTDDKNHSNIDIIYQLKNNSSKDKTLEILIPFNKNKLNTIQTKEKYKFTEGRFITFYISIKANSSKEFKVNYKNKKIF